MRTISLAAVAFVGWLVACSSSSRQPAETAPAPVATHTAASTGPLTEAQFKALHELPTAGPATRRGETITLPGGGDLPGGGKAYLSLPAGDGPHPGIIVIHEWWGKNPNIEHWSDRLASAGWAALAVDLYGTVATTREEAMAAMKAVDPAKAKATIAAGLAYLTNDARIQAPVQAVIGWCFGGAWSLQTAIAEPTLDGAIIYYGHLETDPAKLAPIKARVLGIFGNRDTGIPPAEVAKFEAALKQAGVNAAIHRYDADHAFANPSNPKYDEVNSADAWDKVLRFLDELHKR
ncbi:MAG: dienelactone hydrolase family protein [Deltaproteobacteria bacterium]|nr:dienelactone hydrolase family protein [Deltaproteobacteria bacterium]MDQ3299897.1 dienelactone hydrolase family protein [Myxococcota bacterium]